jgi:hypothetical protein
MAPPTAATDDWIPPYHVLGTKFGVWSRSLPCAPAERASFRQPEQDDNVSLADSRFN